MLDVHARDVVAKLTEDKLSDPNAFDWIAQLRYYWEENSHTRNPGQADVVVKMITTTTMYGYEYLGKCQRRIDTLTVLHRQLWPSCDHTADRPLLPYPDGSFVTGPRWCT